MTVVSLDMAYCSFREVLAGLDTRLDTPPSIDSHHPDSGLALAPPWRGTGVLPPVRAHAHGEPAVASSTIRADSPVPSPCGRPATPAMLADRPGSPAPFATALSKPT